MLCNKPKLSEQKSCDLPNYYESQVMLYLQNYDLSEFADFDMTMDIACVALNNLPVQYSRHDVDRMFFLTPDEPQAISQRVDKAMTEAIEYATQNTRHRH